MPVGHGHAVRTDCRIGYIEVCVQVAWPDPPLSGSFLSARREYTDELGIERNLRWQSGSYTMTPEALKNGKQLCFLQPEDGNHLTLSSLETAYVLPQNALQQLKEKGSMEFNRTMYDRVADESEKNTGRPLLHVVDRHEGGEMWIWDNPSLPVVWRMKNNPLEINWQVEVK